MKIINLLFFYLLSNVFIGCGYHFSEIDITKAHTSKISDNVISLPEQVISPRKIFTLKDGYLLFDSMDRDGFIKLLNCAGSDLFSYGKMG